MQFLKADATATILIGPFVDKGDGVTPETGVTLGAADSAEIMKHDGTTFVDISSLTFTHKAHGMYTLALTTSETDTEGRLTVFVSDESVCLPVWADFMVVNANVYDSLFAAATTDYLQVDTIQVTGTAQTANDNGADINAILVDTAEIGTAGAGLSDLGGMSTGMKAEVESEVDDALGGGTGTALTAIPWNSNWDTEVESEVTDSLVAHNLDHLCKTATGGADMTSEVVDNTIISRIIASGDTSVFDPTTDSLQDIRDKQTDIEADTQDLQTQVGTDGAGLTNLPWNSSWDAEVESEVDDALGGGTGTALTAIPWNSNWDAEVESECNDALVALNLDHLIQVTSTVNDASATTTDFDTALAEASDDHYNGHWLVFTSGNLAGQARMIRDYDGTAKNAAFDRAFTEAPANSDAFVILGAPSSAWDTLLARLADVEGESAVSNRMLLWAAAKLTNKVDASTTTVAIKKTDDSTNLFTQTATEDATADPITVLDTA